MRDVTFLGLLLGMVPLSLFSPVCAVLILLWMDAVSPNEQLFGFMKAVPFSKLFSALAIISAVANHRSIRFFIDRNVVLLGLFLMSATMSMLFGVIGPEGSWPIYDKLLKILILVTMAVAVMTSRLRLYAMVITFCMGYGFTIAAEGLATIGSLGGHKVGGTGGIGDNNEVAMVALMLIPLLVYLLRNSAERLAQLIYSGMILLCLATVVGSNSRGGFIGLVLLAGLFWLKSKHKILFVGIALALGAAFANIIPASYFDRIETIKSAEDDNSFMGRVVAWKISYLIALDSPLIGGGLHAVQAPGGPWRYYRERLAPLDFIPTPPPSETPRAAHSIYFEVLGDLGFTGLFLYLLLAASCLYSARQIRLLCRGRPDLTWAADLAEMLMLAVFIYLCLGAALSKAYFTGYYIIIAIISCTLRVVRVELANAPIAANPLSVPQLDSRNNLAALGADIGGPAPASERDRQAARQNAEKTFQRGWRQQEPPPIAGAPARPALGWRERAKLASRGADQD